MTTRGQQTAARVAGLGGGVMLLVAVGGALSTLGSGGTPTPVESSRTAVVDKAPSHVEAASATATPAAATPVAVLPAPVTPAAVTPAAVTPAPAAQPALGSMAHHYPLQVGRYWVYRYQEPGSDVVTEIERVIVRRENGAEGRDVYVFDDGSVVYFEKGRIFEMGSDGGVNIIPVDTAGSPPPVVYRSQGLQIEKWVGAVDTSLVVAGHRFEDCLEVVTRFRALEGRASTVSYSSFYAPGVGMVGRQTWPRDEAGTLAVTLAGHGRKQL
jgi:hypothetical protein